jgi:carbon storage regulator
MTRRAGQNIFRAHGTALEIVEVAGNTVRLGVDAPRSVPVYREEIWTAVRAENEAGEHDGLLPDHERGEESVAAECLELISATGAPAAFDWSTCRR